MQFYVCCTLYVPHVCLYDLKICGKYCILLCGSMSQCLKILLKMFYLLSSWLCVVSTLVCSLSYVWYSCGLTKCIFLLRRKITTKQIQCLRPSGSFFFFRKTIKKLEVGSDFTPNSFCVKLLLCLSVLQYETDISQKMCHRIVPFCARTSPCSCHGHASSQRDIISLRFFTGRCERDPLCLPGFTETHFISQLKTFNHIVDTYCKGIYIYSLFLNVLMNYF